jgi:hypothetical protein
MEGGDPPPQDDPETHGLEDTVQPRQGDSVIGVIEVEAEEEARHPAAMKVLRRRENGRRPIEDGAATYGAQLGRTEDTGKNMKETGNKHFS